MEISELESTIDRYIKETNDLIDYAKSLRREAAPKMVATNVGKTIGTALSVGGTIAGIAAPFTGGTSLLIGGIAVSLFGVGYKAAWNMLEDKACKGIIERLQRVAERREKVKAELKKQFELYESTVKELVEKGAKEDEARDAIMKGKSTFLPPPPGGADLQIFLLIFFDFFRCRKLWLQSR